MPQIETFYANIMPPFCACMNVKCIQSTCLSAHSQSIFKAKQNTFADPRNINDIIT